MDAVLANSRSDLVPSTFPPSLFSRVSSTYNSTGFLSVACLLNFPMAPAWLGVAPGAGTVGHCFGGGGECIDGQVPLSTWQTLQVE